MKTRFIIISILFFLFSCEKEKEETLPSEKFSQAISFDISEILLPGTPVKCIEITSGGYYYASGNTLFFEGKNGETRAVNARSEILSLAYNTKEQSIYFGTKSSGLGRNNGFETRFFTVEENNLPRNLVAAVECDDHGNVWLNCSAHQLGGLVKLTGQHLTTFLPENSPLEENLIYQLRHRNGKMYVMAQNPGTGKSVFEIAGNNWSKLFETDGCNPADFDVDLRGTVYYIEDSREYCGGGLLPDLVLFAFSGQKKTIRREHENQQNHPYLLEVDKRDYVWKAKFYTDGHKVLSVFDGTQWHEAPDKFPDDFIYCIEVDEKNNIWLGTVNGIYILKQE
jgi:ligand-binding sensor domain-containing protein